MAKKKKAAVKKKPTKKAAPVGKGAKKGVEKKGKTRALSSREYSKLWNEDKNVSNDFEDADVDPGIYTAVLNTCKYGVNKKGNNFIQFVYIVSEGEHEGGRLSNYCGLNTDWGSRIAGQNLKKLDYDMEDVNFEDLEGIAEEITGEKYEVELDVRENKNKDGMNVYLKGIVEA